MHVPEFFLEFWFLHLNTDLVVVDRFTKYSHFIGLSHPFTAQSVARLFFDTVYRLHGLPDSIVSDRDKVFTSSFWQELFKLTNVSLCLSSSYHPQSDGQTERVNMFGDFPPLLCSLPVPRNGSAG